VNGVFTPAFILTAVSNGECQIKTSFGGHLIVCNGIRPVICKKNCSDINENTNIILTNLPS
jgi:hypothetical protein